MKIRLAFPLLLLLTTVSAHSEILYAHPDGDAGSVTYLWEDEVVEDAVGLSEAVAVARMAGGSRPLEIRLLRRSGTDETAYLLDLGTTGSALRWQGSESNRLTIRGQVDRSGTRPRALTIIVGKGSLRQILCEPHGIDLCAATPPNGPRDRRQDLLDYLSGELEPEVRASNSDIRLRLNCLLLWEAAFVDIAEVGFRECWLAAVATYASSNINLHGSVVEGGTYAFAAIARKGQPETAHTFEIAGNVWRQSPSTYRLSSAQCDLRSDWSCPVSVWSDVPWAVVHHHFWSPLNGALFTAKDILGNVRIANNHVTDAYNGIRVRLSDVCLARPQCRERANAGFEIVLNTFEKIRDNAIEPEGRATNWIIKQNTFTDVYAAISTDGVTGHDFLVFGNVFALDDVPGSRCLDGGWIGSRQFRLTLGGGGRWSNVAAEGDDAHCSAHVLGTIIKMGTPDDMPDAPLLERIHFFNNSLRTRSPLFRATPGPPITSYNNVVEFTGCGTAGASTCRQVLDSDPSCHGKDVWTRDNLAIFAACFPLADRHGQPILHLMRFNAYNRAPHPELDAIDRDRIAFEKGKSLENAGCALAYAGGRLECVGPSGPIGAVLPNGNRFDLSLPFGFPFGDSLVRGNETAPPK
jgi:hypothetical protein